MKFLTKKISFQAINVHSFPGIKPQKLEESSLKIFIVLKIKSNK